MNQSCGTAGPGPIPLGQEVNRSNGTRENPQRNPLVIMHAIFNALRFFYDAEIIFNAYLSKPATEIKNQQL